MNAETRLRPHRYDCHVRFSDVDVYGHVNNVKYFEYYQEARIAFVLALSDRVYDVASTHRQVVARIDVDYKRPLLFRPEPYVVQTWVTRVGGSSYDLSCRIVDLPGPVSAGPRDRDETVYSTAEVRLVAFDTATGRSRPLTDDERAGLARALGQA
jgi:acyl-CoA thioester hydrolase